jgi:hypothetical protein
VPRIGGVRLAQFRPAHVEQLVAGMQKDGVSGGNAKKVSDLLRSCARRVGSPTSAA